MIVEAHDLRKVYGRFVALSGLTLAVPEGSIFALLGANGAGKTTFIKTLLNIIAPSGGRTTVLGVDSRAIGPTQLAQIGYVSENQTFPARLRVREFFDYVRGAYPRWSRSAEVGLREELQLPADRRIGALSHGMRLKLSLACALPFNPRLLILDEPFSGLDALVRDEVIAGFLRHAGETSILISSHELDEVERLATHVGIIDGGRLLFQGTLSELRNGGHRPLRDIFVAMAHAARLRAADP
jgi:ABC-2 type transport system ATP-binding protein